MDLIEELRKRDELLAGYLKQIEIQEEFIQKQKELIEYLEDHISKITDIISGCLIYAFQYSNRLLGSADHTIVKGF